MTLNKGKVTRVKLVSANLFSVCIFRQRGRRSPVFHTWLAIQQRGNRVCRMHGASGGAPPGTQNGNYRHGTRTKEAIQAVRLVNLLSRLARKS